MKSFELRQWLFLLPLQLCLSCYSVWTVPSGNQLFPFLKSISAVFIHVCFVLLFVTTKTCGFEPFHILNKIKVKKFSQCFGIHCFSKCWAGEYVGLTGSRLDGAEMLACGLATHFVPSAVCYLLLLFSFSNIQMLVRKTLTLSGCKTYSVASNTKITWLFENRWQLMLRKIEKTFQ